MTGAVLLGAVLFAPGAHAQPVTEKEAATYIYGGFLHDAAHAILSRDVKLGPELWRRLALPPGADSRKVYEQMTLLTDKQPLFVRKANAEEVSRYGASGLRQPLFVLEAGGTMLLIQYDLQANNIPFMGQLSGPHEPVAAKTLVEPPKPVPAPEPPKAVVIEPEPPKPIPVAAPAPPPKPTAAIVSPPPPLAPPAAPSGPCVVKPVMSNQDLVNCGATPR